MAHDSAALSFVDTLACAFASGESAVNAMARASLRQRISSAGTGAIWLSDEAADPEAAAFLNAVSAHALDYDDVAPAWRGHPGAVIFPALASLRAHAMSTERGLLDAYVIGFEVGAALGRSIVASHYPIGWHSTATIGTIAATAACCRLVGASAPVAGHAIGIAVAQAAGVRSNFGTGAKPLQAGFAAAAAVRSCLLATAGFDSGEATIEGPFGLFDLFARGENPGPRELEALGRTKPTLSESHEIKLFPTCYATHRAIVVAIELCRSHGLAIASIEQVAVESSLGSHDALRSAAPATADEARFHMPTVLAMAMIDGQIGLRSFDAGRYADRDVQALAARVSVSEIGGLAQGPRWSRVRVLGGGRAFELRINDLPSVSRGLPAFLEKVADCVAVVGKAGERRFSALVAGCIGEEFCPDLSRLAEHRGRG